MDFWIETKELYVIIDCEKATQLSDYSYARIIGWGRDPTRKDDADLKDIILPWIISDLSDLVPVTDSLLIVDFQPKGLTRWEYFDVLGESYKLFHELFSAENPEYTGNCP